MSIVRTLSRKKLVYSNGWSGGHVNADQLAKILMISVSHAYRIIKDPTIITDQQRLLLDILVCRQIPGFPSGYTFSDGRIHDPSGYSFTVEDLDNLKWLKSMSFTSAVAKHRKKASNPELIEDKTTL